MCEAGQTKETKVQQDGVQADPKRDCEAQIALSSFLLETRDQLFIYTCHPVIDAWPKSR